MTIRQNVRSASAGLAVAVAGATTLLGQHVTGQWDFDDPTHGFRATVGRDGYVWTRPGAPGARVNEYTLIMDILWPADSSGTWRSMLQTDPCNAGDGDIFADPANGVGISGDYEGTLLPDTWHRVILSVNLSTGTMRKFVDGVFVGDTGVGPIDGRHSLAPLGSPNAALLFADNDNETNAGYVAAVQFRNRAIDDATAAGLGGVSSAGIASGPGVTGQWDFDNAADGLHASVGVDMQYFEGAGCGVPDSGRSTAGETEFGTPTSFGITPFPDGGAGGVMHFPACAPDMGYRFFTNAAANGAIPSCSQDLLADTEFGMSSAYGIPDLPDGPSGVMYWGLAEPCNAYLFPHGAQANGGGQRVNDYTLIMDLFIRFDDYFAADSNPSWIALYQSAPLNDEDAMLWINKLAASLGDDGEYGGTDLWCIEDRWMRIVVVMNGSAAGGSVETKYVLYEDDSLVGPATVLYGEQLDGKRTLVTNESSFGEDVFYLVADDDHEVTRGHISSLQLRDYCMTQEEVAQLGGPRAAGIPQPPANCPGDLNGDHQVSLSDLTVLLSHFGIQSGATPADGDLQGDGDVDINDLTILLSHFGQTCPV